MDKSGQRAASPKVIVKNNLRSDSRQIVEGFISIFCWVFLIYILLPIITLILWLLGINIFYHQVVVDYGYQTFLILLEDGGLVISSIFVILVGWTYYNYALFRINGERRLTCSSISNDQDIARILNIDVESLEKFKTYHCLRVNVLDDQYLIRGI
jgi:biofilm PGA synthesis protein PgaD